MNIDKVSYASSNPVGISEIKRFRQVCKEKKIKMSNIIQKAIQEFLKKEESHENNIKRSVSKVV